eukprot:m.34558 g.34558  ORF g.34558 m.34558 type:complete len:634 (+) comp9778_c0_seq2:203-2104(+)
MSLFRRKPKEPLTFHKVTVQRNAQNKFGFDLRGGVDHNTLCIIKLGESATPHVIKGKLNNGDAIISINKQNVCGLGHKQVLQMFAATQGSVKLQVATPDEKSQKYTNINTLYNMEKPTPKMAKIQTAVRKELYKYTPFTSRPIKPGEIPGEEYNFVTREEFELLQSQERVITYEVKPDGHYYGIIVPTTRMTLGEPVHVLEEGNEGGTNEMDLIEDSDSDDDAEPPSVQTLVLERNHEGRLGFAFDGGVNHGVMLAVRAVGDMKIISTTHRELRRGDCILAVNGFSVAGMPTEEVEKLILGLEDPIELTTTCLASNTSRIATKDFLQIDSADPHDLVLAKQDLQRDVYEQTVPYTTRAPRPDEKDGVHYHFVSQATFDKLQGEGFFLEHGQRNGVWYGTPKNVGLRAPSMRRSTSVARLAGSRRFKRRTFFVTRTSTDESLGMQVIKGPTYVFVDHVFPDSLAYKSGLRAGMQITSINGVSMKGVSLKKCRAALAQPSETLELGVRFDRQGVEEARDVSVKKGLYSSPAPSRRSVQLQVPGSEGSTVVSDTVETPVRSSTPCGSEADLTATETDKTTSGIQTPAITTMDVDAVNDPATTTVQDKHASSSSSFKYVIVAMLWAVASVAALYFLK